MARSRKRAAFVGGALALLLLLLAARQVSPPRQAFDDQFYTTVFCATVIDGDTIKLNNGERVRLIGVDTPEKDD